jgi:hypothetical protein
MAVTGVAYVIRSRQYKRNDIESGADRAWKRHVADPRSLAPTITIRCLGRCITAIEPFAAPAGDANIAWRTKDRRKPYEEIRDVLRKFYN